MIKYGKSLFLIFSLLWMQIGAADLFRWVDENGDVHYGDQVPARDAEKGREILNNGGRVIDKVDRARTPEEIAIYEEEQRIAKINREREEKQQAHDRALLATFATVTDLENARDDRIDLLDLTITIATSRLIKQQTERTKLDKKRQKFIDKEAPVPGWIEDNDKQFSVQIEVIEEYILDRELEKEKIRKKFEKDIHRFLELTSRDHLSAR